MTRLRPTLLAIATIGLAIACGPRQAVAPPGGSGAGTSTTAPRGTIGVSVLTLTNPFFKVIGDSIAEEARRRGYDVIVASGEFDVARQQNQVKDFLVRRVAAIVLCPCDSRAIGPAIREANAAGIPVFTADIACLAPDVEVVSHIATDNRGGGRLAGEAMIEALGDAGGKVVILDFKQAESCLLRVDGFKDVIGRHNAGRQSGRVEIVAELPGDGKKDQGYKCAEDALQAHPDLAGIFAINDPSALGARAALEKAGKADRVVIIGYDGQPEGLRAIEDGKLYADPVQKPAEIGRLTVATIARYFAGEGVPAEQLIAPSLYRRPDAR